MAKHRKELSPPPFDPAALDALLGDAQTPAEVDELF